MTIFYLGSEKLNFVNVTGIKYSTIASNRFFQKILPILFLSTLIYGERLPNQNDWRYGFTIASSDNGFSVGGYFERKLSKNYAIQLEANVYDITGEAESVAYNPYTGQFYSLGEKNLVILPTFIGIKFYPFIDKIANNFNPYGFLGTGPLIILNTSENQENFFKRWNKVATKYSFGGWLGLGFEILLTPKASISFQLEYDVFPMQGEVDGKSHYNGTSLKVQYGLKKK